MDLALPFTLDSIKEITKTYPTPFYIYDEGRIRFVARNLHDTMRGAGVPGFRNYFAVKALPNPEIVKIVASEGMGVDCSSMAELAIAEMCGLSGEDIIFSSNNTLDEEFAYAVQLGAIINFDDLSLVPRCLAAGSIPAVACCRFNPGDLEFGGLNEVLIGAPKEAKYGMALSDMIDAYRQLQQAGAKRFGIHTMMLSNELDWRHHIAIAEALFTAATAISKELGIKFDFINLGGGIGVPYRPVEHAFELEAFAAALSQLYRDKNLQALGNPRITMENGRYITADSGYLITSVVNQKNTHKTYVGVDASMSDLMRPGMYGAYHHVTVLGKEQLPSAQEVDIVGSLCENNDKFAIDRSLPKVEIGDILAVHTTGAHGHAMGFQYNGKLRHAELLLGAGGGVRMIRRAETIDDYFVTLTTKGTYNVPTN